MIDNPAPESIYLGYLKYFPIICLSVCLSIFIFVNASAVRFFFFLSRVYLLSFEKSQLQSYLAISLNNKPRKSESSRSETEAQVVKSRGAEVDF